MFVRTMETLAGGEWTGADTWVDVFDPVDVRQPVVRVPALTAAQVTGIYDAAGRGFAAWRRTPALERAKILATAAKHSLPVNMLVWGRLEQTKGLAQRNPDTMIVIDHLGLQQPFDPPAPTDPFGELPKVLELAKLKNVAIKISGACTLSHEPFPYKDIWEPLFRIFDAFGFDRCLWGTDWTRAVNLLSYKQGVDAFRGTDRLSASDRAALMGGSLARIYKWSPSKA